MFLKLKNRDLPLKLKKFKFYSEKYREGKVKRVLSNLKESEI